MLQTDQITRLFTRQDGSFLCARWGRPIVPVLFGVSDETIAIFKGAIEAMTLAAAHPMAETDPELGANLMLFFLRDWQELPGVPNLDRLIPDLGPLCERLQAAKADRYRSFRFDEKGAIKAAFVFLRLSGPLADLAAEDLALHEALQIMLTWSDAAQAGLAPMVRLGDGAAGLHPDLAALLRAAYDPVLPASVRDPSHALRLAARLQR